MIVFVHGVPETDRLWDKVRAEMDRPSTAVSLPGFGTPRPDGFGATKDEYGAWLVAELSGIAATSGEPIDLVGHDWGAGLTVYAATDPAAADWLRSYAFDVGNVVHPDYVWHDFARIWQADGRGEEFFEGQLAMTAEQRAPTFEMFGVAHDDAVEMASQMHQEMAACILALYRSAVPNPHADWGPRMTTVASRGLALVPTGDPFGDEAMASDVADTLGAEVARLEGAGHWWPLQDPAGGAKVLTAFWDSL